jgi:hypothetical protein
LPMLTNCLGDQRLYVQKALGWVLRETGYVYHDEVRAYLEKYITIISSIAFSTAADCFQPADRQELMALRKLRRNEEKRRGRASFDATDASL